MKKISILILTVLLSVSLVSCSTLPEFFKNFGGNSGLKKEKEISADEAKVELYTEDIKEQDREGLEKHLKEAESEFEKSKETKKSEESETAAESETAKETEKEPCSHISSGSATCTANEKCKLCGAVMGKALGHKYSNGKCTRCGKADPNKNSDKHTHSYTSKITKAASCSAKGTVKYTCSCGHSYTESIPKTDHSWKEATCTTRKTCTVCGTSSGTIKGHDWIDATCSYPQTCRVCGKTSGVAKNHTWLSKTCYRPLTCSVCGETSGSVGSHSYNSSGTCSYCGQKKPGSGGDSTGDAGCNHYYSSATCTKPATCYYCGITKGSKAAHSYSYGYCIYCSAKDPNYGGGDSSGDAWW